jgi:3-oxoacyl-ACP reductase-like protein
MSTKKPGTGLAQFAASHKGAASTPAAVAAPAAVAEAPAVSAASAALPDRQRGKSDTVALTVRLPRGEWERLHQLAVAEGTSIQRLAVKGLSRVFEEKGLPGMG